nr:MAG TPA: hypothetical protein [Caudoviricetes sp.]
MEPGVTINLRTTSMTLLDGAIQGRRMIMDH